MYTYRSWDCPSGLHFLFLSRYRAPPSKNHEVRKYLAYPYRNSGSYLNHYTVPKNIDTKRVYQGIPQERTIFYPSMTRCIRNRRINGLHFERSTVRGTIRAKLQSRLPTNILATSSVSRQDSSSNRVYHT